MPRRPTVASRNTEETAVPGARKPHLRAVAGQRLAPPECTIEKVLVDADLAKRWLEGNLLNRAIQQKVVERYALDMKSGAWKTNGDTIRFGEGPDGEGEWLYDGQHRLWAVIESNCPIWFVVVRGLKHDVRVTQDNGLQRKTGDALVMFGNNRHGRKDAAICQALHLLRTRKAEKLSVATVQQMIIRYQDGLAFVHGLEKPDRIICKVPVLAAFVFAWPLAREILPTFVARYRSGENLSATDPEFTLRDFVTRKSQNMHGDRRGTLLKTLRAVLARVRGEKLRRTEASEEAYEIFVRAWGG